MQLSLQVTTYLGWKNITQNENTEDTEDLIWESSQLNSNNPSDPHWWYSGRELFPQPVFLDKDNSSLESQDNAIVDAYGINSPEVECSAQQYYLYIHVSAICTCTDCL
jgi:hypothetical protein